MIEGYHTLVAFIAETTGSSHAMLHVHIGLAIYVLSQVAVGTRRGSMVALQVLLAAELGNEVMNRLFYGSWRWEDTLADIALTLFWPCTLVALSKYRRAKWQRAYNRSQLAAGLMLSKRAST